MDANTDNESVECGLPDDEVPGSDKWYDRAMGVITDIVNIGMKNIERPLTDLVTSYHEGKYAQTLVDMFKDEMVNVASMAFRDGLKYGAMAANDSWQKSLDNVEKRFYELNGGKGDGK